MCVNVCTQSSSFAFVTFRFDNVRPRRRWRTCPTGSSVFRHPVERIAIACESPLRLSISARAVGSFVLYYVTFTKITKYIAYWQHCFHVFASSTRPNASLHARIHSPSSLSFPSSLLPRLSRLAALARGRISDVVASLIELRFPHYSHRDGGGGRVEGREGGIAAFSHLGANERRAPNQLVVLCSSRSAVGDDACASSRSRDGTEALRACLCACTCVIRKKERGIRSTELCSAGGKPEGGSSTVASLPGFLSRGGEGRKSSGVRFFVGAARGESREFSLSLFLSRSLFLSPSFSRVRARVHVVALFSVPREVSVAKGFVRPWHRRHQTLNPLWTASCFSSTSFSSSSPSLPPLRALSKHEVLESLRCRLI